MSPHHDERAKGVDLPSWWLEKVRELVDERGENLTQLGKSLAKAVGRPEPWDHSIVSRFLRNKNTTVPMAEAFAVLLGIPRPFFVPRSLDEALSLQQVARRYDEKLRSQEQVQRIDAVDRLAAAAEADARDQTHALRSGDAERAGSGWSGRATKGRS